MSDTFFEIIQRKGKEGYGNRQAPVEPIELDQIHRGVIAADT